MLSIRVNKPDMHIMCLMVNYLTIGCYSVLWLLSMSSICAIIR